MAEPRNRVVQVRRFGGPDGLEVVDAPLPTAGQGEVRVRVLASSLEYTDVVIRRHLYPQTMRLRPPFVLGYDVVGEIDQLGEGVQRLPAWRPRGRHDGRRVERRLSHAPGRRPDPRAGGRRRGGGGHADLELDDRVPASSPRGPGASEASACSCREPPAPSVRRCCRSAGWPASSCGAPRAASTPRSIRELGATPIDYQREDFTRVLPGGFDVVFDGIGEDGYRRSFAALKPGGLLCAYGYSAGVQAQRRMLTILMWIARLYLWRCVVPGGKRARFYSINADARAASRLVPGGPGAALRACWRLAPSGRASPSGSPSMRSPRRTAASRRAVSRASSSCARTFHRTLALPLP